MLSVAILALAGGLLWRLGGGAATTITGINLGTDPARLLRSLLALIFLTALWWPYALALLVALFVGICIGGWGPFQGMGLLAFGKPESSWKRWLPERLGLPIGTIAHDFIGMAESGLSCIAPMILVMAGLGHYAAVGYLACLGLGFAPCYLVARLIPWSIPRFASGQEWGEVFVGAMLGAGFCAIAMGL